MKMKSKIALVAVVCLLAALLPAAPLEAAPGNSAGPRILRVLPGGGGLLGRDTVVALSFDRPMDPESLARAVFFEPPLRFSVSGESECLVVPDNLLEPDRTYVFHLKTDIAEDLEGRAYTGELALSFTTRADGMTMAIPAFSYSGEIVEAKDPQGVASIIGFGVGHYPGTGRPGKGNFVVMAHASGQIDFTFNLLFDLGQGDEIRVSYGGRDYRYIWYEGRVVRDTEMWIIEPTPDPIITAFVCCAENGRPSPTFHPPYRYVVRASLAGSIP